MKNQKENEIYIRPAKLGDICVLLEPVQKTEIDGLHQRQKLLQSSFGGVPIKRIHLTCQRFACQDEQQLKNLQKHMCGLMAGLKPFSLTALSLRTLYVPIRQTNILKWEIEETDELRQFVAVLEQALVSVGIKPLYRTGFVSSLLAALKEVPELDEISLAKYGGFPYHLYNGEQIVLSQICGPNEFKTVSILPLQTNPS